MKKINKKELIYRRMIQLGAITLGTFLYSVGVALCLDPNQITPGGVTGISMILNRFTKIETGTYILIINIPILFLGWWKLGLKYLISTIYAVIMTTVFTNALHVLNPMTKELLLATLTGAVLCGLGLGLVFRFHATTGGNDIFIKLLKRRFPYVKTGTLFWILDAVVIGLSGIAFGKIELVLYGTLAVYITSRVMDYVLYGADEARMIYIISDQSIAIAKRLLEELGVGATFMEGRGAYYQTQKDIVLCAVPKKRSPSVVALVKQMDDTAFLLICSANEIYGVGYKDFYAEQI